MSASGDQECESRPRLCPLRRTQMNTDIPICRKRTAADLPIIVFPLVYPPKTEYNITVYLSGSYRLYFLPLITDIIIESVYPKFNLLKVTGCRINKRKET